MHCIVEETASVRAFAVPGEAFKPSACHCGGVAMESAGREHRYVSLSATGALKDFRYMMRGLRSLILASIHRNARWVVYLSGPRVLDAEVSKLVEELAEQVRLQGVHLEFRKTDWTFLTFGDPFMAEGWVSDRECSFSTVEAHKALRSHETTHA